MSNHSIEEKLQSKRNNHIYLLETVLLALYGLSLLALALNKRASLFVHPRNLPLILIASLALLSLCFFRLGVVLPERSAPKLSVPVILLLSIPALAMWFISPTTTPTASDTAPIASRQIVEIGPNPSENEFWQNQQALPIIVLTADNYHRTMQQIRLNPDAWHGRKIGFDASLSGISTSPNQTSFFATRLLMSCCYADVTPVSLLCYSLDGNSDDYAKLKSHSWWHLEGTLKLIETTATPRLALQIASIAPTSEPQDPFVYP